MYFPMSYMSTRRIRLPQYCKIIEDFKQILGIGDWNGESTDVSGHNNITGLTDYRRFK